MTRQLPIVFGQLDYTQQLGTVQGATIALYGCFVTSFATLARACGKQTDPVDLNKTFTDRGLYVDGDLITDDVLTKVYPDIVYQKSYSFPNQITNTDGSIKSPAVPADLALLGELMKDPTTWVLLEISLPHAPFTHFVLCTGVNGSIMIADPMSKSIIDFASKYGDPASNIIKYVVYKGTPVNMNSGLDYEALYNEARVDRDTNWNCATDICTYLGVTITPDDKKGMVQRAKDKVNILNNQIVDLNGKIEELQRKYDLDEKEIARLHAELEETHRSDKDLALENLDASHTVNDVKKEKETFVQEVSKTLGIQYDPTTDKNILQEVISEIIDLQENKKPEPVQNPTPQTPQSTVQPVIPQKVVKRVSLLKTILGIFFIQD